MGQVSFHKEFWDCYWGHAIQLKGNLSQSRKRKIRPVWSKNKGGGQPTPLPREHSSHL